MSSSTKINRIEASRRRAESSGPVVVFKWSAEQGWPVDYVSGNVEQVLGYTPEQFMGGELLYNDVIHPSDRDRVEAECNRYVDSGASHGVNFRYRVIRADGELIYIEEVISIVRDEQGTPLCFVGHIIDVTERRQAEVELRQRKDALAEALEIAQLGYWEWDLDRGHTYWSDEVYRMLGVAPGAIQPSFAEFREFVHPDDLALVDEVGQAAVGRRNPYNLEHRIRRRDTGEIRHLRGRGRVFTNEDDQPVRVVGTIQDITETVRSAEVLRHERSWLQSLIQAMPDGISFRDGEGRWLLANDYTLEYLGLKGADYQGKTAEELSELSDNYRVARWDCRRTDDDAWDSGEPVSFEQVVPARDGEPRTFDVIKVPVYEQDDSRKGLLVVARDITERKQTEKALEESRARLADAQRIAKLGSWQLDLDSREVIWSEEVYRIFGLDPQEDHVGFERVRECVPEPDLERLERAIKRTRESRESFQVEHRLVRVDGAERIVNSQGKYEFDDQEQPRRLVGIIQDITERKRVEQLKEEFVSIVSHELRTPLTPITGVLTLLAGGAGGELPARLEKMVELALRNSHRLLYLIDDLLDIQKMSSGQMDFQIRELAIDTVVRESLRINVGMEHNNGVKFVSDNKAPGVTVEGDKGRLIQVMTNLLSNAVKFSPPSSVVDVRLECLDEETVRVSVSDKGPGIPEDFRHRVFEKFAQADSSSTRKHGGTGLGLTIAKSIVERLGGKIGFETELGEGTTFFFDLPICHA